MTRYDPTSPDYARAFAPSRVEPHPPVPGSAQSWRGDYHQRDATPLERTKDGPTDWYAWAVIFSAAGFFAMVCAVVLLWKGG